MPEVIPYALRHSSIVRGLRKGLPIQQVAKLHNTSVKMIERHYAKYIAPALEHFASACVDAGRPARHGPPVVAVSQSRAVREPAEAGGRKGRPLAPIELFDAARKSLHFVGYEGFSIIAASGLDMAAWDARAKAAMPARPQRY